MIGPRAWRVLFGSVSLPLAAIAVFYFINHRYDGTQLWNVQGTPGLHTALWIANFVSFLFLYPSTFNLLEVRRTLGLHACSYKGQRRGRASSRC